VLLNWLPSGDSIVNNPPTNRPTDNTPDDPADVEMLAQRAARMSSSNNLHQIGLAVHNYENANGQLPPPAILDKKTGKPLLSWRVLMLPYIEQEALYQKFKLDEPWDSENNKPLLALMPKTYTVPRVGTQEPGLTHYQAFVGPGAAWEMRHNPNKPHAAETLSLPAAFLDGTSNTILVAEAAEAVPWTAPMDIVFDNKGPFLPKLGVFKGGFQVALADGSVKFLSLNMSETTLRYAIGARDGQVLPADWDAPPGSFAFRPVATTKQAPIAGVSIPAPERPPPPPLKP
jgi:hypothetical protein